MKPTRLHQTRNISFYKFDSNGKRQLTRIVFEAEIETVQQSCGFVWLSIDDPTTEEMDRIIDKRVKPELAKKFGGHELVLLLHNLKQDYRKNHTGDSEHDQTEQAERAMSKVYA